MVLERIYKDFIVLAPKVYGCITNDNKELVKVKGFKDKIPFEDFKSLLIKDSSLELNQTKWFRIIGKGSI